MAKILQIRRGSGAQNDNFTGLDGEITFDKDAKTIRVHDGQTLGGFALARKDEVNPGSSSATSDFDINNVPDSFWESLFQRFSCSYIKCLTSSLMRVTNQVASLYTFPIQDSYLFAGCVLICQTPEAGYTTGEEVTAWGIGSRTSPAPQLYEDENGLNALLLIGQENFWVSNKTTGKTTNITNDNWKLQFRLYC